MANSNIIKVLILSKDFSAQGGVVNYVSSLIEYSTARIEYKHLVIGRNIPGKWKVHDALAPMIDNFKLAKNVFHDDFDCVHINPSFNFNSLLRDGSFLLTLRCLGYRRIVVFFHGWDHEYVKKIRRSKFIHKLFLALINKSAFILVLASKFKNDLVGLGVDESKIEVTTTMYDGGLFQDVSTKPGDDKKKLLFLSRFVKEKGVYELLGAFRNIISKHPETKLIMAGDGPERKKMEKWVRENLPAGCVEFPGYLRGEEKARCLLESNIFVFPTYYGEGCPVALLEAMAAGLAVVTHSVGGIPDVFVNGENGILLDRINENSIYVAVSGLLEDVSYCMRIGDNNKIKAIKYFESSVVTREIESLYEKVSGN